MLGAAVGDGVGSEVVGSEVVGSEVVGSEVVGAEVGDGVGSEVVGAGVGAGVGSEVVGAAVGATRRSIVRVAGGAQSQRGTRKEILEKRTVPKLRTPKSHSTMPVPGDLC